MGGSGRRGGSLCTDNYEVVVHILLLSFIPGSIGSGGLVLIHIHHIGSIHCFENMTYQ